MLQGDVKNLPLPALLQGLVSNHNSGILTLESEQRSRRIGVSGGGIEILHDSDGNSEVLESIVTALDILQPGEISNILSNLGSAALGDALLRLRLVDTSIVSGSIRTLLQEQLLDLFRWQGASYRFEVCCWQQNRLFTGEGVAPSLHFSIPSLLLEVARREDEDRLNEAAGVDLEEIYGVIPHQQSAEAVIGELLDIDPIGKKFFRQLQSLVPLKEVISISGAPRSLAQEAVRILMEQGLVSPLTADEKRELADRLLCQRRPVKAISVLSSLLEQEEDLPALEKLHQLLEQQKAPVEKSAQLLRRLAEARSKAGDDVGHRKALRQRADLLPQDLDAHLDLLRSLPDGKSRRETERLLEKIYNNVRTVTEALEVAEAIEACRGGDPIGDPRWLERCARLRISADDQEGASKLLDTLIRNAVRAGKDRKSLIHILELLRQADPTSHDQWQSRLQRNEKLPGKKGGFVVAMSLLLVVMALFHDRTATEKASALPPVINPVETSTARFMTNPSETDGKIRNAEQLLQLERAFSHAVKLKTEGNYREALHQLSLLHTQKMPATTIRTIEKFRGEIENYLQEARSLLDRSLELENKGAHLEALSVQVELARNFPHSPILEDLKLQIPLKISPSHARILIDGKEAKLQRNGSNVDCIVVPADGEVVIRAECQGYDPQSLWHRPGSHSRLSLNLSRRPDRIVETEGPIGTVLAGPQGSAIIIDRESTIRCTSGDQATTNWQLTVESSGDLVRGAVTFGDSVVVATSDGSILRIDARTGSVISETQISTGVGIVRNTPILAAGKLFLSTSRGVIHALDRETLKVIWTRQVELIRRNPLVVANDLLIAIGSDLLFGINPTDGSISWQQELDQRPVSYTSRGAALFVTSGSKISRYSTRTGNKLWQLPITSAIPHSLVTSSNLVIQICTDGSLQAIDPIKGILRWTLPRQETEVLTTVASSGLLAISDSGKRIRVIDLGDGHEKWIHRGSSTAESIRFVANKLLVASEDGSLLMFDLAAPHGDLSTPGGSS